jgi:hypothetical protein
MKKFFIFSALAVLLMVSNRAGLARAESLPEIFNEIEIHGFASTSYNYNFNNPVTIANGNSTNRVYDRDSNTFKFDSGELVFLKDTPNIGDIGFRTDLNYGNSVPAVNAANGLTGAGVGLRDDFDVQQAYVSYNAPVGNGLQIDMGKFITHVGAEVIQGHDGFNYNFSRSFMFGLGGPFVHTGVRTSYSPSENLSLLFMISNDPLGDDVDNNNDKAYGAQVGYKYGEDVSVLLNWVGGNRSIGVNNNSWMSLWDMVVDVSLSEKTLLQVNVDYGVQAGVSSVVVGRDSNWWGISTIVRHDYNKWFSMNARAEYFSDEDGTQTSVGTVNNRTAGQKLWEFTVTPEIRVQQNLVVRFEYRHDASTRFAFRDTNNNVLNSSQDTVAANALFYF